MENSMNAYRRRSLINDQIFDRLVIRETSRMTRSEEKLYQQGEFLLSSGSYGLVDLGSGECDCELYWGSTCCALGAMGWWTWVLVSVSCASRGSYSSVLAAMGWWTRVRGI